MLFLLQVFLCGGEHQLDPVQLINFTGSGIVINGNNIGFGITLAQLFYYPLADHVVGQAVSYTHLDVYKRQGRA